MSIHKRYRYRGVKPFGESDSDIFFGRDADVEQIYDLILLEKLVVLFSKSGYGKSSLLNAGLMPLLHDFKQAEQFRYLPVPVRLYPYADDVTPTPAETTRLKIQQTVAQDADATFLQNLDVEPSLWLYCKRLQAHTGGRIVLIFDQFEEFFTYPAKQQAEFRQQLAELLYTTIPQGVRSRMSELPSDERSRLVSPMDTKALLSIRADRLSLLDSMKGDLPDILLRRYELRPLSLEQARTAMVRPAALTLSKSPGDSESRGDYVAFATEPFGYTDAAIEKVVQHLLDPISNGVEAFLLQVACLSIENRVEAGLLRGRPTNPLPRVDAADWPPLANIMDDYYHQQIAKIMPAELRPQAYRLIEDRLLFVHPETGDTRRLSMDSAALQAPQTLLDSLENHFLIRREANALGGYNYELCHDRLMEPALASRNVRLEQERVKIMEQERVEQEENQQKQRELAEAKKREEEAIEKARLESLRSRELQNLKDKSDKNARRANVLAAFAVAGSIIAGFSSWEALEQKQLASESLIKLQTEQGEKEKLQFREWVQRTNDILNAGHCPPAEFYEKMRKMENDFSKDDDLQDIIKGLREKTRNCY